jgi:predicted enzyme related to lactoylglutathione lyase
MKESIKMECGQVDISEQDVLNAMKVMHKSPTTTNMILYCKEWGKTVRFYRDQLHLIVSFSTDWFVEFALTTSSRLSVADEKRSSIKSCEGKGVTLALEVEDIDGVWEYMEKIGVKPTVIRKHPWDARVFHLYDPEGHRIEIWQPLNPNAGPHRNSFRGIGPS